MTDDVVVEGACPSCAAVTATPYRLVGYPTLCPACGTSGVAELVLGSSIPYTGFALTYRDLASLITDGYFRERVGPLVETWLDCTITGTGEATTVTGTDGEPLALLTIHERIQADAAMAYELYQVAMDYWR